MADNQQPPVPTSPKTTPSIDLITLSTNLANQVAATSQVQAQELFEIIRDLRAKNAVNQPQL